MFSNFRGFSIVYLTLPTLILYMVFLNIKPAFHFDVDIEKCCYLITANRIYIYTIFGRRDILSEVSDASRFKGYPTKVVLCLHICAALEL